MSDKNYPEDGFNDLLSALASKPNKPQWLNTFVRTLQSRDVTLETWNSLINVIAGIASDTISVSDFLQILYKNCVWSVKGSANPEEKIGNVVLELSDFGINIDVSKINSAVYADENTIYDKDGNILKLSNVNLAANSVNTDTIASGAVNYSKLASDVVKKLSTIEARINTKVSKLTPGSLPTVYTMLPEGLSTGIPATSNKDAKTFVYRDANGRAKFADPSDMYDASNKNYVDTVADTKLNRKTSPSGISVYAENPNGEAMVVVSSNGFPYTIMFRDVNGRSKVSDPDPNSATDIANVKFVKEQVAGIVNSAPGTLDTLQELADALGRDPNFATTVATELGKKATKDELIANSIEDKAYTDKTHYGYSGADLLIIPDGVTNIPANAYKNTTYKCVVIPNSVVSIGIGAFYQCFNLEKIITSDSIKTIGRSAFMYCTSLKEIEFLKNITNIAETIFAYCASFKSVIIPNGITTIGKTSFANCSNLTDITVPNSVTNINYGAFFNCQKLSVIDLTSFEKDSLFPALDDEAFYSCPIAKIKVIKGRKAELAAMTNWSAYADHIVEVPTVETLQKEIDELKAQLLALTNA